MELGIELSPAWMVDVQRAEAAARLTGLNLERCWGTGVEGPPVLQQHNQRQNSARNCFILCCEKKKKSSAYSIIYSSLNKIQTFFFQHSTFISSRSKLGRFLLPVL